MLTTRTAAIRPPRCLKVAATLSESRAADNGHQARQKITVDWLEQIAGDVTVHTW
jgi:hypothetical protein